MKYSNIIMDHFAAPRNVGPLADATHAGEARNEACLDWLKLHLRIGAGGTVEAATFQAEGCVPCMAAGSFLTEWTVGQTLDELRKMSVPEIETALGGLPSSKKHAAYLVKDVLASLHGL